MNMLNRSNKGIILSLFVISLVVLGSMIYNFTLLDLMYLITVVVCVFRFILIKKRKKVIHDMV
ncbi:MAG: hypothetical protein IJ134_02350 [Bacilli bacterium]|nr:hypothetical protein [Bacilli bacterium]